MKLEVIDCTFSTWSTNADSEGAQIAMLIDRADRIINLCGIKFSNSSFTIDKGYAKKLRNKLQVVSTYPSNKNKSVFLTMITTFGINSNEYENELVQSEVELEDLFAVI